MKNNYMRDKGVKTREKILRAGLEMWPNVTALGIAKKLTIKHTTVLYHFKDVRKAVEQHGLDNDISKIIVYLIITNDKRVSNMSDTLKTEHFLKVI